MDKDYLEYIFEQLIEIRNGLLDDSSRTHAAFNLGMLMCSVEIHLHDMNEEEVKEFGHT